MRLRYFLPVIALLVLSVFFFMGLGRDPSVVPSPLIDKPVPAFSLPALAGREKDVEMDGLASSDLRGEVSVVNVFASWCAPCRVEHPVLTRLATEFGVSLHGINYKNDPDEARAWLARLGDPFRRIGADRDGRAAIELGVYGVPETFVIDRDGRIRYRHVGPLTPHDLENVVVPLIREVAQ